MPAAACGTNNAAALKRVRLGGAYEELEPRANTIRPSIYSSLVFVYLYIFFFLVVLMCCLGDANFLFL